MNKFERDEKIQVLENERKANAEKIIELDKEATKLRNTNMELVKQIEKLEEAPFESANMKITEITDDYILFDNNYTITYAHDQDCCENNYADFKQLKDTGVENVVFKFIDFERVENSGFRFGDDRFKVFVPCYSDQNGYYSDDLDIYLNNKKVLSIDGLPCN